MSMYSDSYDGLIVIFVIYSDLYVHLIVIFYYHIFFCMLLLFTTAIIKQKFFCLC